MKVNVAVRVETSHGFRKVGNVVAA
jgi:hypothetical protein